MAARQPHYYSASAAVRRVLSPALALAVMAVFAAKRHLTRTIVMVGTITDWPIAQRSLDEVAALHNVKFIVPDHAAFATAIGAALSE